MTTQHFLTQSLSFLTTSNILLLQYTAEQVAFAVGDVNTGANTITLTGASYVVGTRVRITGLSEFNSNQIYFSISAASPYSFSETPGGTAVNIGTAAAGTVTDAEPEEQGQAEPGRSIQAVADAVRYELTDYEGEADRPVLTFGSINFVNGVATLDFENNQILIDNTGGSSNLVFGYAAAIENGNATPGNTTGDMLWVRKFASLQTVSVGELKRIQFEITSRQRGG